MATRAPARMPAEARREQLLDVTKAIVAEHGFHAVSIEGVAREAGISRPIVYGHFHDLAGPARRAGDARGRRGRWPSWRTSCPPRSPSDDPRAALVAALGGYLEAVRADPETWRLVLVPHEGAPRVLHERISLGRAAVVAQLAAALRPRAARGLDSPDPELTAHLLTAFADEAARLLLADPDRYPRRAHPRADALVPATASLRRRFHRCDPPTRRCVRRADGGRARRQHRRSCSRSSLRRLLYAAGTIVLTAFFAYGLIRLLRPGALSRGVAGLRDVRRRSAARCCTSTSAGRACSPAVRRSGGCGSTACGPTCSCWPAASSSRSCSASPAASGARRARARGRRARSRAWRWCSSARPAYVVGFTLLLLFAPPFGLLQLPWFFEPHSYAPPLQDPWDFIRSMIMPWLVVGAPLAGAVPAADARALPGHDGRELRAHGDGQGRAREPRRAPPRRARRPTSRSRRCSAPRRRSWSPTWCSSSTCSPCPGFFRHMRRALGQAPGWPPSIDIPTLQALAMWAAVLIVALSLLADLAIARLDPRMRAGGRALCVDARPPPPPSGPRGRNAHDHRPLSHTARSSASGRPLG